MPGTTRTIGVRLGGFGEITPRSVCGVNAPTASPAMELFAGVVAGLLVVRSGLSKQTASASRWPKAARMRSQRVAANSGEDARIAMASARRVMISPPGIPRAASWRLHVHLYSPEVDNGGHRVSIAGPRRTGEGPAATRLPSRRRGPRAVLDARRNRRPLQGEARHLRAARDDHRLRGCRHHGLTGRNLRGRAGGAPDRCFGWKARRRSHRRGGTGRERARAAAHPREATAARSGGAAGNRRAGARILRGELPALSIAEARDRDHHRSGDRTLNPRRERPLPRVCGGGRDLSLEGSLGLDPDRVHGITLDTGGIVRNRSDGLRIAAVGSAGRVVGPLDVGLRLVCLEEEGEASGELAAICSLDRRSRVREELVAGDVRAMAPKRRSSSPVYPVPVRRYPTLVAGALLEP